MILNHRYKFIFIKTRKTAGTSIELALSQFCEKNDIISPLSLEDEEMRTELGYPDPQNYNIPLPRLLFRSPKACLSAIRYPKNRIFYRHIPAERIKRAVSTNIWNNYYKFCFDRNPFDRAISRYYWQTRNITEKPDINEFILKSTKKMLSNWHIYTIDNKIAINFVGKYENLKEDLKKISKDLKLPTLEIPNAKSNARINREHYSKVLSLESRTYIEKMCADEINYFDYEWQNFL